MKLKNFLIVVLTLLVIFSTTSFAVTEHKEFYLTIIIPEGFKKIDNDDIDSSITSYSDPINGRQINIVEQYNNSDIDYANIDDGVFDTLANTADTIFIPDGSEAYFTEEPQVTKVDINSNKGIKMQAKYVDPSISDSEIYSQIYMFSAGSYSYGISFISYAYDESWNDDCLNSLVIGKGMLEEEITEEENNYATEKSYSDKVLTSDSLGPADFFEGIGTLCGIALIIYLIYRLFSKRK